MIQQLMNDPFLEDLVAHLTAAIEDPGIPSATESFTLDWPMAIAQLALLLDMPPAKPRSRVLGVFDIRNF